MRLGKRWKHWPGWVVVAASILVLVSMGAMLGADTFGNVAEWAAAVGTIAAFGGTVALLRRDVDERERRQASLVSCWGVYRDNGVLDLFVRNGSDETIYDIALSEVSDDGTTQRHPLMSAIGPHREERVEALYLGGGKGELRPAVTFIDAASRPWGRDRRGRLTRHSILDDEFNYVRRRHRLTAEDV